MALINSDKNPYDQSIRSEKSKPQKNIYTSRKYPKNLSDHHTSVNSIQINFEQEPHYIKSNHKFHKNHKKHKNLNKNKTTKYRGHPYVNLQKTQKKSKTHE
eukprot:TRINITY_DN41854_c0_g1_i1.p1 TRINITY_DN41854_c0_g1~~TRINITY_DN41854_c0_g1_i1.p1  ORF type:complete len:101 (+),score=3.89 TRINITY_DN41854_c0_g1_i1:658-960(+)